MKKTNLVAIVSLAMIVPVWGTFHPLIGVASSWPAFASASLFFASEQGIKGCWKIAIGHILGLIWGLVFLNLLNLELLAFVSSNIILYVSLFSLTILAVLITTFKPIDHLPSLFSGWAITVGSLSPMPLSEWQLTSLDTLLSMMGGVFFIGVGVTLIQQYLKKEFFVQTKER